MKKLAWFKEVRYICSCGATKTVRNDPDRTGASNYDFPKTVICGYRGCFKVAHPFSK